MLGVEPERVTGRAIDDLSHPDDRAADREATRLLLAGECRSYTAEKRLLGESGEPVWVLATVTHVPRSADTPEHFVLRSRSWRAAAIRVAAPRS